MEQKFLWSNAKEHIFCQFCRMAIHDRLRKGCAIKNNTIYCWMHNNPIYLSLSLFLLHCAHIWQTIYNGSNNDWRHGRIESRQEKSTFLHVSLAILHSPSCRRMASIYSSREPNKASCRFFISYSVAVRKGSRRKGPLISLIGRYRGQSPGSVRRYSSGSDFDRKFT